MSHLQDIHYQIYKELCESQFTKDYEIPWGWDYDEFLETNNLQDSSDILWEFLQRTWINGPVPFNVNQIYPFQFLFEMHNPVDLFTIINILKRKYDSKIEIDWFRSRDEGITYLKVPDSIWKNVDKKQSFLNTLDVMQWYLSREYSSYSEGMVIEIAPKTTKNMTNFVLNKCDGKIYHICNKEVTDIILRTGFRPKNRQRQTIKRLTRTFDLKKEVTPLIKRDCPARTYFFAGDTQKNLLDAANYVLFQMLGWDWHEADVFEVDFRPYKQANLWEDDANYSEHIALYTYTAIHPKHIKLVTNKFMQS